MSNICLLVCSGYYSKNTVDWYCALNNNIYFSVLETEKLKVKVTTHLVSGEPLPPGSYMNAVFPVSSVWWKG